MRQFFPSFFFFLFFGKRRGSVLYIEHIISLENQSLKLTKSVKYFKNRTMDKLNKQFEHLKDIAFGK